MKKMKNNTVTCLSCGDTDNITMERRLNGYYTCLTCGYKWQPPQEKIATIDGSSIIPATTIDFSDGMRGYKLKLPELTKEQVESACLSYRHDFGFLSEEEKKRIRLDCKFWYDAIRKEFE